MTQNATRIMYAHSGMYCDTINIRSIESALNFFRVDLNGILGPLDEIEQLNIPDNEHNRNREVAINYFKLQLQPLIIYVLDQVKSRHVSYMDKKDHLIDMFSLTAWTVYQFFQK